MKKILNIIKKFFKLDIVRRVLKTFVQAFLGVLIVVNIQDIQNVDDVTKILMSGISASISAVWNLVIILIKQYLNK